MKKANLFGTFVPLFTLILLSANLAWADSKEPSAEAAGEKDIQATVSPEAPKGLSIPVDGSSLEAFEESLAEIKATTTEAEFETLSNAIDYLLVYNLSAKRDRAKLAKQLDGQTGYEIIDQIGWRKPAGLANKKSD